MALKVSYLSEPQLPAYKMTAGEDKLANLSDVLGTGLAPNKRPREMSTAIIIISSITQPDGFPPLTGEETKAWGGEGSCRGHQEVQYQSAH